MTPAIQYSDAGLALTERFEGCRLTAYQDAGRRVSPGGGERSRR